MWEFVQHTLGNSFVSLCLQHKQVIMISQLCNIEVCTINGIKVSIIVCPTCGLLGCEMTTGLPLSEVSLILRWRGISPAGRRNWKT